MYKSSFGFSCYVDFGPAFVTADPQECIQYISGLTADGGGDCPEMANSGLELGIQNR